MSKQKGISLVTLIITIIIIIILAAIGIYNGALRNITETSYTMDYNEIFEISEAVSQRALLNRLNSNSYALVGTPGTYTITMKDFDDTTEVDKTFYESDGWYKVTKEQAEGLELKNVRGDYLVNYSTGEVISMKPIVYENRNYYAVKEIRDAMGGNEIIAATNRYDDAKGVNKPYVVSGMVPVKLVGSSWVITNVDDNEWYDYAANDSGKGNMWANVMLQDEIVTATKTNEEVRNSTLSSLEGDVVTSEGSMYVWIPRYTKGTYQNQTKLVFSRGTKDYFTNDSESRNAFKSGGIDLTGIWISKYDASYIER